MIDVKVYETTFPDTALFQALRPYRELLTECVSKIIAKLAESHGHQVYRKRISTNSLNEIELNYDILGIGYPIYFRQAPSLVADFITKQNGKSKQLFTFCTKGMYSGNATKHIQILAKQNLFSLVGNLELYMPGSDALALIAKKESLTERMLKNIHSRKIKTKIEIFYLQFISPRKWMWLDQNGMFPLIIV